MSEIDVGSTAESVPLEMRPDYIHGYAAGLEAGKLLVPSVPDAMEPETWHETADQKLADERYCRGWNDCRAAMLSAAQNPAPAQDDVAPLLARHHHQGADQMTATEQLLSEAQSSLNELISQGRKLGWDAHAAHMRMMTRARAVSHEIEAALAQPAEGGEVVYGCHCDLEPHMQPDGCVLDEGKPENCVYSNRVQNKEQCVYWKPIAPASQGQADTLCFNLSTMLGCLPTDEEVIAAVDSLVDALSTKASHSQSQQPSGGEVVAKKLIGWRTENFLLETDDPDKARNWEPNIGVLPIFEGDPNTKLTPPAPKPEPMTWQDVASCPDGDAWFSLSCGHVVIGFKHGEMMEWSSSADDCCFHSEAIKAIHLTRPAHHNITKGQA